MNEDKEQESDDDLPALIRELVERLDDIEEELAMMLTLQEIFLTE